MTLRCVVFDAMFKDKPKYFILYAFQSIKLNSFGSA